MATSKQNVRHEKVYVSAHSESKRNFQMPTYLLVLFLTQFRPPTEKVITMAIARSGNGMKTNPYNVSTLLRRVEILGQHPCCSKYKSQDAKSCDETLFFSLFLSHTTPPPTHTPYVLHLIYTIPRILTYFIRASRYHCTAKANIKLIQFIHYVHLYVF